MKKQPFIVIIALVFVMLGAAACQRSASAPPAPVSGADFPIVEGTPAPMEALAMISTQTAIAEMGGVAPTGEAVIAGEDVKPSATPPPPAATVAPPAPQTNAQEEANNASQEVNLDFPVPDTYTLKPGEFPFCIARRFDIAPETLLAVNGLSSSSVTYPGTVLKIPKDAPRFNLGNRALRQHPTSYTVQPGDTVNSIACLFGDVDPRAIEAVNGLKGAYSLNVGQTLQIP